MNLPSILFRHPDDNRESSTSGYQSSPRPPRAMDVRDESPLPDTEPMSEFSETLAPPLFRTPRKSEVAAKEVEEDRQSYV
uniref:Uncharacterized protein n=1 Tax=Caenorhabditis japonica TaxID=281687 RepID=A0A8R1I0H9_CAEJA